MPLPRRPRALHYVLPVLGTLALILLVLGFAYGALILGPRQRADLTARCASEGMTLVETPKGRLCSDTRGALFLVPFRKGDAG